MLHACCFRLQTEDRSAADMTVDVDVFPEVRGELDAAKLSRLLQLFPVITGTFARVNCLAAVSAADRVVYPPPLARVPVRLVNPAVTLARSNSSPALSMMLGDLDDLSAHARGMDLDTIAAVVTGTDENGRTLSPTAPGSTEKELDYSTPMQSPLAGIRKQTNGPQSATTGGALSPEPRTASSTIPNNGGEKKPTSEFGQYLLKEREIKGLGTPDRAPNSLGQILQMEIEEDPDLTLPDVAISSAIKSQGNMQSHRLSCDPFMCLLDINTISHPLSCVNVYQTTPLTQCPDDFTN